LKCLFSPAGFSRKKGRAHTRGRIASRPASHEISTPAEVESGWKNFFPSASHLLPVSRLLRRGRRGEGGGRRQGQQEGQHDPRHHLRSEGEKEKKRQRGESFMIFFLSQPPPELLTLISRSLTLTSSLDERSFSLPPTFDSTVSRSPGSERHL